LRLDAADGRTLGARSGRGLQQALADGMSAVVRQVLGSATATIAQTPRGIQDSYVGARCGVVPETQVHSSDDAV